MSQSFIKKPDNGPHSALAGMGVLASEKLLESPAEARARGALRESMALDQAGAPFGYVSVDVTGDRGLFRAASLGVPENDALHTWVPVYAPGVAGLDEAQQEKELGACSLSRATIGVRTHDRRPQESNRSVGEEKQRSGEAGRCDATRASGAELGARGGNAAQHQVAEDGGTGNGAACGVPEGQKP
jgi:hypothetical protein